MNQCFSCGTINKPGARFCQACGSALTGGMQTIALGGVAQGRYQVIQLLGQGGMGAVYQVADMRIGGKLLAMKEMSDAAIVDPTEKAAAIAAFEQEAQLLARLDHPNIPKVSDFFTENQKHYIVMEFVQGETLDDRLTRQGTPCGEAEVRDWALQLCDVLSYLHGQNPPVIFRDLKPGNIMLTPQGQVKLIDFGIARLFKPGKTGDTQQMGTPGYASPEQYGKGQTDARSDVYSLGVVLHHLLTRYDPATTPFKLPPVRQLAPTVSTQMAQTIARATMTNIAQRHQSVSELRQDLLAGAPTSVVSSSSTGVPPTVGVTPSSGKGGVPILTVVILAAAMLGAGVLIANAITHPTPTPAPPPSIVVTVVTSAPVVGTSSPVAKAPEPPSPTSAPRPTATSVPPPVAPTKTYTPEPIPTRTSPPPPSAVPPSPTEDVAAAARLVVQNYGNRKPEFYGRGLNATNLGDFLIDPELEEQRRAVCWLRNEGKYYDYGSWNRTFSVENVWLEGSNQVTLVARISEHLILRGGTSDVDFPAEPYRAIYQLQKGSNGRWYIFCIHVVEDGDPVTCINELKDPNPCR